MGKQGLVVMLLVTAALVLVSCALREPLQVAQPIASPVGKLTGLPGPTPIPPYPPPGGTPGATPTLTATVAFLPCQALTAGEGLALAPAAMDFTFSDPRVVLTSTSAIAIADWLPNGQQLLITRYISGTRNQTVDLFDARSGEVQNYGHGVSFDVGTGPQPVWLDALQAVAFSDRADDMFSLNLGRGTGAPPQVLVSRLLSPYFSPSRDGRRVVLLTNASASVPQIIDAQSGTPAPLPFTLPSPQGQTPFEENYRMAWHPDGSVIAFYNAHGLYLVTPDTGQACEVDLGSTPADTRWTFDARWSPDGRYLAARTIITPQRTEFWLMLYDTTSGTIRSIIPDGHVVASTWMGSTGYLLVGVGTSAHQTQPIYRLYIVNPTTGELIQVRPDLPSLGAPFWGLAWSDARQEIAFACPDIDVSSGGLLVEGRLCTMTATRGDAGRVPGEWGR